MTWKTLDGQVLVDYSGEAMSLDDMDSMSGWFGALSEVADETGLGPERGVSSMLRVSFNA